MRRKKNRRNPSLSTRSGFAAFMRRPATQLLVIVIVAFIVYLIAAGGAKSLSPKTAVNVDEAFQIYQQPDVLMLDVRETAEWDTYHAPNAKLIPLGELQARLGELPKDKKILVVCRDANCSQQARDVLIAAGFNAINLASGFNEWYNKGYPIEGAPQ